MKYKKLIHKYLIVSQSILLLLFTVLFSSCEEELPGVGEIPDLTPPQADFSFEASEGDYKEIVFSNLSISATDFVWDFGDGGTSSEANPTHIYSADGAYSVMLTATDKLGVTSSYAAMVEVTEPISTFEPEILNPGFDIEGDDSFRDHWRNEDLGGVIQITSSPVHDGEKAAKMPSDGSRIGYQLITVERNKEYTVSFYYTIKESPAGSLSVSVLAGDITDPSAVAGATIESVTVNDQSSASTFVQSSVTFNSGDNSQVAIYFTNEGAECRVDTFGIVANE